MMRVYIYRAELLCDWCGSRIVADYADNGVVDDTGDSDDFPQEVSNGEADSPCHCGHCGVFLENPLTPDGDSYVRERAKAFTMPDDSWDEIASRADHAGQPALADWIRFYFAPGQ
jgi:hypothetical protein